MAVYAYLRVSTDQQDVDNQRHGILSYCNTRNLIQINFIEDTVSGRKKWRERKIGELHNATMQPGDTLVVSEISRMARSTLQVLEGRPPGPAARHKLDDREMEIRGLLDKRVNKRAIAKIVDCAPSTLYDWLKRKGISRAF